MKIKRQFKFNNNNNDDDDDDIYITYRKASLFLFLIKKKNKPIFADYDLSAKICVVVVYTKHTTTTNFLKKKEKNFVYCMDGWIIIISFDICASASASGRYHVDQIDAGSDDDDDDNNKIFFCLAILAAANFLFSSSSVVVVVVLMAIILFLQHNKFKPICLSLNTLGDGPQRMAMFNRIFYGFFGLLAIVCLCV